MKNITVVALTVIGMMFLGTGVQAEVPRDGLVAEYLFDNDTSGIVYDTSGNGNDGDVNGATPTTNRFGNTNSAYSFDGDDYIQVEDSTSFSINTISISTWINPTRRSEGNNYTIISQLGSHWGSDNSSFDLHIYEDGTISFALRKSGDAYGLQRHSLSVIEANNWYHVCGVYDGNDIYVYINGVLENGFYDGPLSGNMNNSDTPITIGKNYYSAWEFPYYGTMDNIRIYNRALSESEIQELYYEGNDLNSGLVAYYPFNGNANDTSESANANDGIEFGEISYEAGKIEEAASFNGINDYITIGYNDDITSTNKISISAWIKINNIPSNKVAIISGHYGNNNGYDDPFYLGIESDGSIKFSVEHSNQDGSSIVSNSQISTKQWFHVVAIYDYSLSANNQKLFINSTQESYADFNKTLSPYSHDISIGAEITHYSPIQRYVIDGLIDEVRIYNRALSESEIQELYTEQPRISTNWSIQKFYNTTFSGDSIEIEAKQPTSFVCSVKDDSGNIVDGLSYEYDFGDGSYRLNDSFFPVDYQYNTPGVYIATCTVTDSSDNSKTSNPITVTVYEEKTLVDTGFRPSKHGLPVKNGTFYENVLSSSNDFMQEWDEKGSCMAISIMTQMYYKNGVPEEGLYSFLENNPISASIIYLSLPTTFRNIFQTIGNLYAAIQDLFSKDNDLNNLISAIEEMQTGVPAIIAAMFDFSDENNAGHAVLAYKLTYLPEIEQYRLYVYDSNSPGEDDDCYFTIEQNSGSISYSHYKKLNKISAHVPSSSSQKF